MTRSPLMLELAPVESPFFGPRVSACIMDPVKSKLLLLLAEINHQEPVLSPSLSTVVGRYVYFSIAREILRQSGMGDQSLKRIFNHPEYSDRAIRLKLREMEVDGLIEMNMRTTDKRSRHLKPTDKLISTYERHAQQLHSSFASSFYLIERASLDR